MEQEKRNKNNVVNSRQVTVLGWSLVLYERGGEELKSKPRSKIMKSEYIVWKKLLYTFSVVFLYLVGRKIPLYGVDTSAYLNVGQNVDSILTQMIAGDAQRNSVFALGVSPFVTASIVMQIYSNYRKKSDKGSVALSLNNRLTILLTILIALIQAVWHLKELIFRVEGSAYELACMIVPLEMVTGVMIILWLSAQNKRYGIGGRTAIIYVNILDGMLLTFRQKEIKELWLPLLIGLIVILVMGMMENAQMRFLLQRISIHSMYAKKDYLAIKLNPVGVMPIMYASALFSLLPLERTTPVGFMVYLGIICILTIGLSGIFLNLDEVAEELQKGGDGIMEIRAGKDTRKYLSIKLRLISCFSAAILCLCIGIPLLLQMAGIVDASLAMFPVSVMMMTGMWMTMNEERKALDCMEKYRDNFLF